MKNKHIIKIDLILILGSVLILLALVGYVTPRVIFPLDEYSTTNTVILFQIKNAEKILIDDNIEFTSPEEFGVYDNLNISLKPGNYYWKAIGLLESEVRMITVTSLIDLRLKNLGEGNYGVFNAGNTNLNVDVYDNEVLIKKMKLNTQEYAESEGDKFLGVQDE